MPLKLHKWDTADWLTTEEDRLQYLVACIEESPGDAAYFAHALGDVARSRNMSQVARDSGLTREGLYKALSELGNPSFDTVLRVVRAMGYRLTIVADATTGLKRVAPKRVAAKRSAPPAQKTARKAASRNATAKPRPSTR